MDKIKEFVFKYLDEVVFKDVVMTHQVRYDSRYSRHIKNEIEGCVGDYRLFHYIEEHVSGKDTYSVYFDNNIFFSIKDLFSLNITQIDEYINQYFSSILGSSFNESEIYCLYLNDI